MIWDIDFVWGMRVYNKKSQINFEIHSGWMICSQLTAVGLWNLVTYLVVTTFFAMLEDIDLIFGLWVHSYELQIKAYISFRCNAIWPSYGPWTLQLGQIFSGHHFISPCFEILTWMLVWECIIITYRSLWNSLRLNDCWPTYSRWALKFGRILSCHHFISLWFEVLSWFVVWECIIISFLAVCTLYLGDCVLCSFSRYCFWLPLWYLQTILALSGNNNLNTM